MTRIEENEIVIGEITKTLKPSGTYEELMVFHLGTIGLLLGDISKSLAIIADKVEREND